MSNDISDWQFVFKHPADTVLKAVIRRSLDFPDLPDAYIKWAKRCGESALTRDELDSDGALAKLGKLSSRRPDTAIACESALYCADYFVKADGDATNIHPNFWTFAERALHWWRRLKAQDGVMPDQEEWLVPSITLEALKPYFDLYGATLDGLTDEQRKAITKRPTAAPYDYE